MKIAVVGGAGFIGRYVCREVLARRHDVQVVDASAEDPRGAIDISVSGARERLAFVFEGVDAVIHLAARVDPVTPKERIKARALHVDGTRAVVRAMHDAGVKRLVLTSSAVVYGALPENPVPLDERAPLLANDAFFYSVDKREQERIVYDEARGIHVVIARPAIVYGQNARNYLTEILRNAPVLPALNGCRPPLQFVHVEDVARALVELALNDVTGAFNVAPMDWLSFDEVASIAGVRTITVPRALIAPVLDGLARVLPPHLRAPAAMLPYLMYPFVLSSEKLRTWTAWTPTYTSADTLRSIL